MEYERVIAKLCDPDIISSEMQAAGRRIAAQRDRDRNQEQAKLRDTLMSIILLLRTCCETEARKRLQIEQEESLVVHCEEGELIKCLKEGPKYHSFNNITHRYNNIMSKMGNDSLTGLSCLINASNLPSRQLFVVRNLESCRTLLLACRRLIYCSLEDALRTCQYSDVIYICGGVHVVSRTLLVDKNITVVGLRGSVIQSNSGFPLFEIGSSAKSVRMQTLTIDSSSRCERSLFETIFSSTLHLENITVHGTDTDTVVSNFGTLRLLNGKIQCGTTVIGKPNSSTFINGCCLQNSTVIFDDCDYIVSACQFLGDSRENFPGYTKSKSKASQPTITISSLNNKRDQGRIEDNTFRGIHGTAISLTNSSRVCLHRNVIKQYGVLPSCTAIKISSCTEIIISSLEARSIHSPLKIHNSKSIQVNRCIIGDRSSAVYISNEDTVRAVRRQFDSVYERFGIDLYNCNDLTMSESEISRSPLFINDSINITIHNCVIKDASATLSSDVKHAVFVDGCSDIVLRDNKIMKSTMDGSSLYLSNSTDVSVSSSEISECVSAITNYSSHVILRNINVSYCQKGFISYEGKSMQIQNCNFFWIRDTAITIRADDCNVIGDCDSQNKNNLISECLFKGFITGIDIFNTTVKIINNNLTPIAPAKSIPATNCITPHPPSGEAVHCNLGFARHTISDLRRSTEGIQASCGSDLSIGIYINTVLPVTITNNSLADTGNGVVIERNGCDSILSENNFLKCGNSIKCFRRSALTITMNNTTESKYKGILILDGTVAEVIISKNKSKDDVIGIAIQEGEYINDEGGELMLSENIINHAVSGIKISLNHSKLSVQNCTVSSSQVGIVMNGSSNASVKKNEINDCDEGISLSRTTSTSITYNTIIKSSVSISITNKCVDVDVIENNCLDALYNLIHIKDSFTSIVKNKLCKCQGDAVAISISSSLNDIISELNDEQSITISENEISEHSKNGIKAHSTTKNHSMSPSCIIIKENIICEGERGILIENNVHCTVTKNALSSIRELGYEFLGKGVFNDNTINKSKLGMTYSSTTTPTGMFITNCDIGIQIRQPKLTNTSVGEKLSLRGSSITECKEAGIQLSFISDVGLVISDVSVSNSKVGILIENTSDCLINKCFIKKCEIGIKSTSSYLQLTETDINEYSTGVVVTEGEIVIEKNTINCAEMGLVKSLVLHKAIGKLLSNKITNIVINDCSHLQLTENEISSGGGSQIGISIYGESSNPIITKNIVEGHSQDQIYVSSACPVITANTIVASVATQNLVRFVDNAGGSVKHNTLRLLSIGQIAVNNGCSTEVAFNTKFMAGSGQLFEPPSEEIGDDVSSPIGK